MLHHLIFPHLLSQRRKNYFSLAKLTKISRNKEISEQASKNVSNNPETSVKKSETV